uniref:Uncharacterized protein n=1 Tax=Amblyomma aureolatum TaxID=187763 RepID=A0A1E1XHS1_9ACAR
MGRPKPPAEDRQERRTRRREETRERMRQRRQDEGVRAREAEQQRRRRRNDEVRAREAERQREPEVRGRRAAQQRRRRSERALKRSRTPDSGLVPARRAAGSARTSREDTETSADLVSSAEDNVKDTCGPTSKSSDVTGDSVSTVPPQCVHRSLQAPLIPRKAPSRTKVRTATASVQTDTKLKKSRNSSVKFAQVVVKASTQQRSSQANLKKIVKSQFSQTRANDVAIWMLPEKT